MSFRLITSGWWAAAACILVSLGVVLWLATARSTPREPALGDGRTVASYGFDLGTCLVPRENIVSAGMPRDGLHSVDAPNFLSPAEVLAANPKAIEPPVNVGGWTFTPTATGSDILYYLCTDVGGSIPRAVQSAATKGTLPDTLGDLVSEAGRRAN